MARCKCKCNKARQPSRRRRFAGPRRQRMKSGAIATMQKRNNTSIIRILPYTRALLSALPIKPDIKSLFHVVFDMIEWSLGGTKYYPGACAAFEITPGSMVKYSPITAKDSTGKYSFPSHPVKAMRINIRIFNTSKFSEHMGKWAAVFIPYRELHDHKHFDTISKYSYEEISAMPYAVSGPSGLDLYLNYRFAGTSDYCSRPRELTESIGLVYVLWDSSGRSDFGSKVDGGQFSCDIEMSGTCRPLPIFDSSHRTQFDPPAMEVVQKTLGNIRSIDKTSGTVILKRLSSYYEDDFEHIHGDGDDDSVHMNQF